MAERNINVLLVEDDKFDRRAMARYIQKMELPYTLHIAASTAEAMNALADATFDVVLLDYQLGDGNGLELLAHIKDTPAIFVTGSGSEEIAVRAMRQGAYDYLIKDPESNYLTVMPSTIQSVLARKRSETALRESDERYRGLAEFANAVIHNVGNVLNSVNASCQIIKETIKNSKIDQLGKVAGLLEAQADQGGLEKAPKFKLALEYLGTLHDRLKEEIQQTGGEIDEILKSLTLMREIIAAQQSQAKAIGETSSFDLREASDEAFKVCRAEIEAAGVEIRNRLSLALKVKCPRADLVHILINLFRNAVQAMEDIAGPRVLTLDAALSEGAVRLRIADTGAGIEPEALRRLFRHGFTTKAKGHGFGLHYCANAVREMGGDIHAESEGAGKGSAFTVVLPHACA